MTPQLAYFIAWEREFRASLFELRERQPLINYALAQAWLTWRGRTKS
jgi:hypothetical protein